MNSNKETVVFELDERVHGAIPLTEAAHTLGLSYLAARDLLLRGRLRGFKHEGRWYVEAASVATHNVQLRSSNETV